MKGAGESRSNNWLKLFLGWFVVGLVGLSGFYYLLLFAVTGDPSHPAGQFFLYQPWMSLLIVGFGVQVGLYGLVRKGYRLNMGSAGDANMAVGTGATSSGIAMVACCAHHVVDVLPILGLAGAALFLSEYQREFLMFGVVANIAGIMLMLWQLTGQASVKKLLQIK